MKRTECPGLELLTAYAAGKLTEEASLSLDEHLDECSTCQARIRIACGCMNPIIALLTYV